ncbi:MAG: excalibur calcium-binding domain-containing protein [Hyphomonadaceae bacterium]
MLKRTLRRLRTWAPPISMGVIIGAGAFLVAERIAPVREPVATGQHEAGTALVSRPSRAYSSCDAARAAGAAPLRSGDPGYGPHLDADGDGIACEPHLANR